MDAKQVIRSISKWVAAGTAIATASYATYVGVTWFRYGHVKQPAGENGDALLDRFMANYEIGGRHKIRVSQKARLVYR
jgi:hypothetical protein